MPLVTVKAMVLTALALSASDAAILTQATPSEINIKQVSFHSELSIAAPTSVATQTPVEQKSSADLGVFKSVAISAAGLPAAAKWQAARTQDETGLFHDKCKVADARACDTAFARSLQSVAQQAAGLSDRAQLDLVNRAVNDAMRYRDDQAVWGLRDHWATPSEMALKGSGDCEDFAIAKYWLLRSLGVADENLQMVVLQDTRRQLFHAVLVVHTASGAYVLDNVTDRLQADTAYTQYMPIISFAGSRNFVHGFDRGTRSTTAMPRNLAAIAPGSAQ
ncbi:transglutaminase-like cysteine peptidase [Devosia sp. WQ 349]|uniref:transglutaminase-like cysteine peptidase n=1 Tax=Devosia sp. WQ 349K1 TaxID=2800329 RepID=UPI0019072BA0|nr:transglutaminase-like cysteine peptidase [Devosia sp. WQ 349K1]MBK1796068.1 transglutaminase-like cysteine peptidase [Devosia sp. WQ 349K1]